VRKAKKILVGLKILENAVELTDMACRLGARGAGLLLVHVIELPDNTPLNAEVPNLEAEARKILRAGERVARRSRLNVKTLTLRAHSASFALLDELKGNKSDLAVLGYHHGRTLGEVVFGTTAKHLVTHAPCHVVLSIWPRHPVR
jgi:nucleotide-binding universal stress UspA family protein